MNTEIENASNRVAEPVVATAPESSPMLDVSTETPGTLQKMPSSTADNSEWLEVVERGLQVLSVFPDFLGKVLGEYRSPLTTVGLILFAGLGIAVADGVLARLNTIPLFAPTFELVGLGFTGWFIVRYLLYADTRQELLTEYREVKERIAGDREIKNQIAGDKD
jgi:CAAD domains of cyanobacterial aminoacyl-tRNA synthetase